MGEEDRAAIAEQAKTKDAALSEQRQSGIGPEKRTGTAPGRCSARLGFKNIRIEKISSIGDGMNQVQQILHYSQADIVGPAMITLLLGTHIFLTIRLHIPQRHLWTAIKLSVRRDHAVPRATCCPGLVR